MPASGDPAPVVVGRFGAPHGVAGEIRVNSFTQPPDNLLSYAPWLVRRDAGLQPVERVSARWQGRNLIVRLAGVNDRDAALALRGSEIVVPRDALPEPSSAQEHYWQDLIGLSVVDTVRGRLGEVRGLMATGAHDVLVIGEGELLIPFVEAYVHQVDLEARVISVTWQDPV